MREPRTLGHFACTLPPVTPSVRVSDDILLPPIRNCRVHTRRTLKTHVKTTNRNYIVSAGRQRSQIALANANVNLLRAGTRLATSSLNLLSRNCNIFFFFLSSKYIEVPFSSRNVVVSIRWYQCRRVQKESDELLRTTRSLVMVRNPVASASGWVSNSISYFFTDYVLFLDMDRRNDRLESLSTREFVREILGRRVSCNFINNCTLQLVAVSGNYQVLPSPFDFKPRMKKKFSFSILDVSHECSSIKRRIIKRAIFTYSRNFQR